MTMERRAENTTIEIKGNWMDDITKSYKEYIHLEQDHHSKEQKKTIYKWPGDLVIATSDEWSRTPHMASFGPYHHGKEHLKRMEHHKERALYRNLQRSGVSLSSLVSSLSDVEQELRSNYDDLDDLNWPKDLFLRMMLLDGCFILELLRPSKSEDPKLAQESHDHSLSREEMLTITVIHQDVLMLENQIPLLVLKNLLGVLEKREINDDELVKSIIRVYDFKISPSANLSSPHLHVLDVYRKCLIVSNTWSERKTDRSICLDGVHFLLMVPKHMMVEIAILVHKLVSGRIPNTGHVRSATRFHEAGIEFNKNQSGVKITFDEKKGVLHLPYIDIEDHTAVIYMNLMAFERMHPALRKSREVTSFVAFMDTLIDTAEDVHLLSSKGIISNHLGSDEDAAKVFNKLGDGIVYSLDQGRHERLQNYVASDRNIARANLEHNYFKNPWSILSLFAAFVLLVLTLIQTVTSVMGAFKASGTTPP